MINEIQYRLGDYLIIEHGGSVLTWISHVALGIQLSGRCFIIGDILVIGPEEHDEAGFLKMEFNKGLIKLPAWNKTKFYCLASSIWKVGTKQSFFNDLVGNPYGYTIDKEATKTIESGTFRLGRYKITVDEHKEISWQTMGVVNRIISGKCIIESGILFIGPKENEEESAQSRRNFLARQRFLIRWDKTPAWGYYESLKICGESGEKTYKAALWRPEDMKVYLSNSMAFHQRRKSRRERSVEGAISESGWIKKAWQNTVEWKIWLLLKYSTILVVLAGLRFMMYLVRECVNLFLRIIHRFTQGQQQK